MERRFVFLIVCVLLLLICSCQPATPPLPATAPTLPLPPLETAPPLTPPPQGQAEITITLAPPDGSLIRPLLGVNAGPLPAGSPDNADVTRAYQEIGVTMIRTHDYYGPLDMATLYPDQTADPADPASYDFEASDRVYAAILDGGFEPYLRLGDSWNTRDGFPAANPRRPTHPENWTRAAVEVVRHYNDSARWGRSPLRYIEIWNEPNHPQFWDGSHREFFELFAQTLYALKAEFPNLQIGGPGLAPAAGLTPEGQEYTESMLDYLQHHNAPLDFFSWHIYSNDPAQYAAAAVYYREQLDSRGYTATESHITEWNAAPTDTDPGLRMNAKGAAFMTAAWIALQENGVDVSTFYRGNDTSPDLPTFYGLFFADGHSKPSGLAFSLWAEMAAHPNRLSVTSTGSGDAPILWVLAGQNLDGEIALLVANTSDTATSWQAVLDSVVRFPITVHQISEASADLQELGPPGPNTAIAAHAVQLAILNP